MAKKSIKSENIFILIGSSDYINEKKLPACKNDIEEVEKLIRASASYDDGIVLINETTRLR